ncbi:MAG: hypothetical protein IKS17_03000 [Firmicutes bacterium]|nr:hypothetical protein [Bacillota bacterium]
MTGDWYLECWYKDPNWWDIDENGKVIILPDAPQEAKDSYKYFLEKMENGKLTL